VSQPLLKRVCVGESGSEVTGEHSGDMQHPRTPSFPNMRPATACGGDVGDVTTGSLDDELELPDRAQLLAATEEMQELGARQVICQLSSSCSLSDSSTLVILQIPRPLQPARSSSDVDPALVMAEMTSPTALGMTASQVQNHAWHGALSRAPVLQQHSVHAAGGCAVDHVSETSHGGQGGGRGGSGWGSHHPAGTSSVRFPGSAQERALELVTEQDIPGRHATPGWHCETRACHGDSNVPTTASTHMDGSGGGWDSDGGSDVSASEAVSAEVPTQHETVSIGRAQSALGHALPQRQSQDEDLPSSDMLHADDMTLDGGELQHDMDE
jgi:hypothetical protein